MYTLLYSPRGNRDTATLTWQQANCWRHDYVLLAGDDLAATLRFDSHGRSSARCAEGTWSFRKHGFLRIEIEVILTKLTGFSCPMGTWRPTAAAAGGGTLTLARGGPYLWSGFTPAWRQASTATWSDPEGEKLITFEVRPRYSVEGEQITGEEAYYRQAIKQWLRLRNPVVPGHDVTVVMERGASAHPNITLLVLLGKYLPLFPRVNEGDGD